MLKNEANERERERELLSLSAAFSNTSHTEVVTFIHKHTKQVGNGVC